MGSVPSLEAMIWVEESREERERFNHRDAIDRALSQLKRQCQIFQVRLISVLRGALCSDPDNLSDTEKLWRELQQELSSEQMLLRAEDESRFSEVKSYIDELVLIPSGTFYQGEEPYHQS